MGKGAGSGGQHERRCRVLEQRAKGSYRSASSQVWHALPACLAPTQGAMLMPPRTSTFSLTATTAFGCSPSMRFRKTFAPARARTLTCTSSPSLALASLGTRFSARPLRYEANRRLPPRAHRGDWRPAHRFSMTGSISRKLLLGDYRTQWMVTTPLTISASRSLRSPTSSRPVILRLPGAASPGCGTDLCTTTKEPTGPSLRASRLTRYRLSLSKCRKSGGPFLIEPTVSARPTLPRSCPRARGGGRGRGSPWRRGRARCGRGLPPSRRRWCGSGNRS